MTSAPWLLVTRLDIDQRDHREEFYSHRAAYLAGRRFSCARGARRVAVLTPERTLAHSWHRRDNRWIDRVDVPEDLRLPELFTLDDVLLALEPPGRYYVKAPRGRFALEKVTTDVVDQLLSIVESVLIELEARGHTHEHGRRWWYGDWARRFSSELETRSSP